jgi:hypothetical protein
MLTCVDPITENKKFHSDLKKCKNTRKRIILFSNKGYFKEIRIVLVLVVTEEEESVFVVVEPNEDVAEPVIVLVVLVFKEV